jgi:transposase-like protein
MRLPPNQLVDMDRAAAHFDRTPQAIRLWRRKARKGRTNTPWPEAVQTVGYIELYRLRDLERWVKQNMTRPYVKRSTNKPKVPSP